MDNKKKPVSRTVAKKPVAKVEKPVETLAEKPIATIPKPRRISFGGGIIE